METITRITRTLFLLLLLSVAACQQKDAQGDGNGSSPNPNLPTDIDLGHGYVKRDGTIHFIGGGTTGTGANATRIDTPSWGLLTKMVASKYGAFKTAKGLDVASFKVLSEQYTRDENHVYFKEISTGDFVVIRLPDADPATFEVLEANLARDKNHVWYYNTMIDGADPSTVKLVNGGQVFKDKDSVHYGYDTIAGADPASFKHLASGYYQDKNRIYWCTDPIPDVDPATFKVMGGSFVAKDRSSVYRSGKRLPGFDVASVEFIQDDPAGYQFLSDKNGIYLNEWTFPRSKPGKVEVIDNFTVKVGDLIHTVSAYQYTPVTVFKEQGKLMAEAPCYDPTNDKWLGMIRAEVTNGGLSNIHTVPLPGQSEAPSLPDWQRRAFERSDLVQRMIEGGKLLK
jgi:hypothetical protein